VLATWNVNSLKVRLPHVLDWLASERPDALCLQELKLEDKAFRAPTSRPPAISAAFSGQKTYNGVAILSREPATDVQAGIPGFDDEQKRVIAATVGDVRIVCATSPTARRSGRTSSTTRCAGCAALTDWLRDEMKRHPKLALLGDYNIAPGRPRRPPRLEGRNPRVAAGARRLRRPARTRACRRLPPVRAAGKELLVVGLPDDGASAATSACASTTSC
jgi:exodeoxyribonuclease III